MAGQVLAATGGRGLDFAFDFAGVGQVLDQAAAVLGSGGTLVLAGLTPEPTTFTDGIRFSVQGQKLLGHYGSSPVHVE